MKNNTYTDNIQIIDNMDIPYDKKEILKWYWSPNISVYNIIKNFCSNNTKILEIGHGKNKFEIATHFIGCNEEINDYIDIDKDKIPFDDKYFNFIYCRHVLGDIQNPDFTLSEIFRVSNSFGYIETPSPLIEITKDIDYNVYSDLYGGYIHHRYIVWSSIEKNEIYFLPKYSCLIDNYKFDEKNTLFFYLLINEYPIYWNNYFIYDTNKIPNVIMYKNGINFNNKSDGNFIDEYIKLLHRSIEESIINTNYFIKNYSKYL